MRFFGKIRQQLLSQNRFVRYLVYAIGEIILVVIGILVALQVNNWNESQKNNELQRSYLAGIVSDLDYDIRAYSNMIDQIEGHRQSVNSILTCYKDRQTLPDSVLIDHLTNMSFIAKFSHRSTVMDDMKSSGRLNLVTSDSIRIRITEYYKLASQILDNNDNNNDWILNHIIASKVFIERFGFNSTVYHTYKIPENMKSVEVGSFSGLPLLDDINNPEREQIINLLTAKNWLEGLNQNDGFDGRQRATELKSALEDYLKSLE